MAHKPTRDYDKTAAFVPRSNTQVVYPDRPKVKPKGLKASRALMLGVVGKKSCVLVSTMQHLGPQRTLLGLRFDDYAVLRRAAAQKPAFDCFKLILAALPHEEIKALMRRDSALLCDAAERAGHIDYANWLIYTYGDDRLQYISER